MSAFADLPLAPAGDSTSQASDAAVWHHRAFCRIALPVRAPSKGIWQREVAGVVLGMEAGEGVALPTGKCVRLLLMHLFDLAVRGKSPLIEIGDDPAAVAERIGLETAAAKLREMQEQMGRLLATRITVAWDGGPALSVFDARGRRGAPAAWRSAVRMNARFQAGLADNAVALDRGVLKALADSTLALDLYAWLASGPAENDAAQPSVLEWDELRRRFASVSSQPVDFRAGFEQAVMQVQQAWPRFASVMRDDAVEFRRVAAPTRVAEPAAAAPKQAEAPQPVLAGLEPPDLDDVELALQAELESELMSEPDVEPVLEPEPEPEIEAAAPAPTEGARQMMRQTISLKSHLTGLPQVIWLGRANGRDNVVIEVTPGGRYDPETTTVIALEPVALQVVGGLYTRDFERVAAWAAANRDLIDDWWDSRLQDFEEVASRVKKVPAPAWR